MGNLNNIPKLRFSEFNEPWFKHNLGEIANFSKGKGISKAEIAENGATECIRYGELYTTYGETINEVKSRTNIDVEDLVISEANDVIIPASGETQIDIATASCVLKAGIALGGDLNIIKTKNNGVFLSYYLNSKKKLDIASLAQGISVVHLYSSQLTLLELNLPSIPEQTRIATFLTAVDSKLQSLKKKKSLLEEYKKGVMQRIFLNYDDIDIQENYDDEKSKSIKVHHKNHSSRLRFKDENGKEFPEWEVKKLGEVCDNIQSGKDKGYEEGNYNLFGSMGIIGKCKNYSHDGKYILIARVGANAGSINIVNGKFGVSDNTLVLTNNKMNDIRFMYYLLINQNLNKLVFGSGQPLITGGHLKALEINLPSLPEQTRIANFLSSLDEKIQATQVQIDKMEAWKRGLLQKMFV